METLLRVWNASLFGRLLGAICQWFSDQWRSSRVIRAFVSPLAGPGARQSSLFYRLWSALRGFAGTVYEKLKLDRIFEGSIFLRFPLWCALMAGLAPLLPTMAVLGLAAVALGSLGLNCLRDRTRKLAYSPIHRYVLLYAGSYLAATFTSLTPQDSLYPGILTCFFILFCLVVGGSIDSWKMAEDLVLLMSVMGALVAALGVGQYLLGITGASSWLDSGMFSTISGRVYSTLQNPNVLAEYFLLIIPLGGAGLLTSKDRRRQAVLFVCCALMCLCMVLTVSRGGWLGLLFAGALFVAMLKPRLLIAVPFALVLLYLVLPGWVVARFTSIGNMSDTSTSYRVSIWLGSLRMLKDYWLSGLGPGTAAFNRIYPLYSLSAANAQHAHNLFLQIMCEGGICALTAFGLAIGSFYRALCGAFSRAKAWRARCYTAAALGGISGFLVQSMTDYTFYNYRVTLLFWVVLGLGAAFARLAEEEGDAA